MERRQVIDIPPVRPVVTEHQLLTLKCGCGEETKAGRPGRRGCAGAVRARDHERRRLPVARPVPVPRPRLPGAVGAYRLRPVARRARRRRQEDRGTARPGPESRYRAPDRRGVVYFDETGFRTAGRLAWVHSASSGKFVLLTVHAKRGKDGMKAAGVLPFFRGIAVHDAWKPYDSYDSVARHALCNSHLLRELIAVTETGTSLDKAWAQQAIDALLALKKAAEAALEAGKAAMNPQARTEHEDWFRKAAARPAPSPTGPSRRRLRSHGPMTSPGSQVPGPARLTTSAMVNPSPAPGTHAWCPHADQPLPAGITNRVCPSRRFWLR